MYKSIILIATIALSTKAYIVGPAHDAINNNFAIASMELKAVAEKEGLRVASFSHKKHPEGKVQAGGFNIFEQRYECAQGFAYGLQFSPLKQGACYISVSEGILAAQVLDSLVSQFYNPTKWADVMRVSNSYVSIFAAINNNCNVQKLIKTLTTDPATLAAAGAGRIGGGFIFEIPQLYLKMKRSGDCYDMAKHAGQMFSLFLDYYI